MCFFGKQVCQPATAVSKHEPCAKAALSPAPTGVPQSWPSSHTSNTSAMHQTAHCMPRSSMHQRTRHPAVKTQLGCSTSSDAACTHCAAALHSSHCLPEARIVPWPLRVVCGIQPGPGALVHRAGSQRLPLPQHSHQPQPRLCTQVSVTCQILMWGMWCALARCMKPAVRAHACVSFRNAQDRRHHANGSFQGTDG